MKTKSETLPKTKKGKKIDINKFEKLAAKIKKYFDEEERYLEKTRSDANSNTSGIFPNS
ncbi:MAG: hypothetical protein Q7S45_01885 [Candidatus Curtissbacteria bacterium]|nr:hypothetical protein [Candidatus Curtissbacteria bacterium]